MSHAGGLLGPPGASHAVDALPPGLGPQPPQQEAAAAEAQAAPTLTVSAGRKRSRTDDGGDPAPRASSSPPRLPSPPLDVAVRTKRSIKPDAVVPVDEAEEIQVQDDERKAGTKLAMEAAQGLCMYRNDERYKNLFDSVADFFTERLKSDLDMLRAKNTNKIGLAAKWCPSPDSGFNRTTLLCEAIARRLFPWAETNDEDADCQSAYHALRHLRRKVLVPLRAALQLPEVYVSSQRWSELPYHRVAKMAMVRYKEQFMKHDQERFKAFMEQREANSATHAPYRPQNILNQESMAEDAYKMLPHTIISRLAWRSDPGRGAVYIPYVWQALVNDLKAKGLFDTCIAVCDLSESMKGTKRHACVALGLLLAELGGDGAPWKNSVRLFGMKPKCYFINQTDLAEQVAELNALQSQCEDKIDLRFVFTSILIGAKESCMGQEVMTRTIFVITDKEFDQAIARPWRNDYKAMCEKFTAYGFGHVVPQVVYWNLGGRRSAALTETKDGVMRVSGFSNDFLRLFLHHGGIVTPEDEMHASITVDAYNSAVVLD